MKAMILAAGRGERMRPLTDTTPKPLLLVAGKPIIQYTIEQLVKAGFTEIVINIAHLGQQIKDTLGTGNQLGATLFYSDEGNTALETAGGISNAIPLLGEDTFLVVNGDIATDYDFSQLYNKTISLAHLILIPNPPHHPEGDFYLSTTGYVSEQGRQSLTYSGVALFHPKLFESLEPGMNKLGPLLRKVMPNNKVSGEKFKGFWLDIGTPERLIEMKTHLKLQSL
ncbi:MAG: nucleotidyltransferase family protein [Methylococcales bacterium]